DFVAITWQTLRDVHPKQLQAWFIRPCYVIVDEAHHVGARTFDLALTRCKRYARFRGLIGLTATPQPASDGAKRVVAKHFPRLSHQSTVTELIEDGVLARPRFYVVRTCVVTDVDDAEEKRLARGAEPSGLVLFKLASDMDRNRLIV